MSTKRGYYAEDGGRLLRFRTRRGRDAYLEENAGAARRFSRQLSVRVCREAVVLVEVDE